MEYSVGPLERGPRKPKPMLVVADDEARARLEAISRIEHLVAQGRSRVTAERIVEVESGHAEAGRARRHPQSHR